MVGNAVKIKIVKNKVAPPFKTANVDMMYGEGISKEGCILDLAESVDIIQKSGSWYAYNDEKIGQGRDKARTFLKENAEIRQEIENKVRIHYNLPVRKFADLPDEGKVDAKEKELAKI